MPSWIVPPDNVQPSTSGHDTAHDEIADDLTKIVTVLPGAATGVAVIGQANIIRDQIGNLYTNAGASTATLTFPSNPQAGSTVLVAVANVHGAPTLIDNGTSPTTFTIDVTENAGTNNCYIYRANNITLPAAGGYQINVTLGGLLFAAQAISYLNVLPGAPLASNVNIAFSGSSSVSTGSVTGQGLFFAGFSDNDTTSHTVTLTNASFTSQGTSNGSTGQGGFGVADWVQDARTTTTNCTWTLGASSGWYSAIGVYSGVGSQVYTPNNTLDNGTGAATFAGNLVVNNPSAYANGTFVGSGVGGSQYSNFNLADNIYPLDAAGHYWAFSHRAAGDHSLLVFNYNGSTYKNVFFCGEDGSVGTGTHSSQRNVFDDGSGNMTVAGSGQPPLAVSTSATGAFINTFNVLAPSMTAGQQTFSLFGQAASTNNSASINFHYSGAGSTSNSMIFNFFGGSNLFAITANGTVQTVDNTLDDGSGNATFTGNVDISTAGKGLQVKEGSNAKQGTLTLNGTTAVVVSNTSVTANSRILLTIQLGSGTVGSPYVSARTAGTSFSVKSTASGDTSTCAYFITEPG